MKQMSSILKFLAGYQIRWALYLCRWFHQL